jgi:hypothetical protein
MGTETKGYFLVILGIIILLVASIVFFVSTRSSPSASQSQILEDCKTLHYNGPGKMNILFFSKKQQAEKYADFFLETEPFKDNKEEFNFFYIDDYEPDCRLYKGIAVLCHSQQLVEKAASCPHDFIVVLEEENEQIRSSSYLNVMSLNSKHVLTVFLHEFGHAFANLAEEYINNQNPPRRSKNCQSECSDFDSEIDGCFNGCSKTTLKRSVNEGVMRTLFPDSPDDPYGSFNTNLIQEIISSKSKEESVLTGDIIYEEPSSCIDQRYILYYNGEISVNQGCVGTNGNGPARYTITKDSEIVLEESFSPIIWTDVQGEQTLIGESQEDESQPISLTLPLMEADTLEIYDSEDNLIEELTIESAGAIPCQA